MTTHPPLLIGDLAGVVYSAGKVFDGLGAGRLDTESFLRHGETTGISSRADLALLEDLRDAAQFVIAAHARRANVDGTLVREINRTLTRSAALRPGELRRDDQHIGVETRYGKHRPPALAPTGLDVLVAESIEGRGIQDGALELFVRLARAQPFEDGNRRTALFAANIQLLRESTRSLLQVPLDPADPSVSDRFHELLARAYVFGEVSPVKAFMSARGMVALSSPSR